MKGVCSFSFSARNCLVYTQFVDNPEQIINFFVLHFNARWFLKIIRGRSSRRLFQGEPRTYVSQYKPLAILFDIYIQIKL